MTSVFKETKNCDTKTKNIINGYIHEMQKLFPWEENSYFIIPKLINHICLSFYWIRFAFNRKYAGNNLEFINESTVTKLKGDRSTVHSLCSIGESISGDICNSFRIEYHLKDTNKSGEFCPYIGFFTLKSIDDLSSEDIDWNETPGYGKNASISIGICIYYSNPEYVLLFGSGNQYSQRVSLESKPEKGDRFMLEFDFIERKCCMYHNEHKFDRIIPLNCSHIIPCLSLDFAGEVVEITKYEFN